MDDVVKLSDKLKAQRGIEITHTVVPGAGHFFEKGMDEMIGEVEGYVRAVLFGLVGAPSLEIDAASIRDAVEEIGWVARAKVRLAAPDTLMVSVEERTPRAIWRRGWR